MVVFGDPFALDVGDGRVEAALEEVSITGLEDELYAALTGSLGGEASGRQGSSFSRVQHQPLPIAACGDFVGACSLVGVIHLVLFGTRFSENLPKVVATLAISK